MPYRAALVLALALLVAAATPSLAQNRFFADGANGLTVQGGWVTADEADGFGGALNLTFNGRLDLGVNYVAPSMEVANGYEQDWEQITPNMGISLVRPKPQIPVGIDLIAGYTFIQFGGAASDLIGGDAQTFGLEVSGCFGKSRTACLVPNFGVYYHYVSAWSRERPEDPKLSRDTKGVMVAVELALRLNERFLIVPGTSSFDGDTTWSIMGGFALELK